ncbi:hypothetical protein lerEdw1_020703 [Lerista edwardsae]|nr:hypothetical protein lerEdw1_020703 [Lerista edwardsae]
MNAFALLSFQSTAITFPLFSPLDSVEDVIKFCPDCPLLETLSDPQAVQAADITLAQFNTRNVTSHYKILEISRAQHTDLPDGVYVEFAIAGTNCTAKQHAENCHVSDQAHFGFCKASVIKPPIAAVPGEGLAETIDVTCDVYDHQDSFLLQPGPSHTHLTVHHLGGNRPSPGVGFKVLDLIHSHNNTHASHESRSAEVLVPAAAPVVKRAVAVEPVPAIPHGPFPVCPGKTHHFHI